MAAAATPPPVAPTAPRTEQAGQQQPPTAAPPAPNAAAPAPATGSWFASCLSSCYPAADQQQAADTQSSWGIFSSIQPCVAPIFAIIGKIFSLVWSCVSGIVSSLLPHAQPQPQPTAVPGAGPLAVPTAVPTDYERTVSIHTKYSTAAAGKTFTVEEWKSDLNALHRGAHTHVADAYYNANKAAIGQAPADAAEESVRTEHRTKIVTAMERDVANRTVIDSLKAWIEGNRPVQSTMTLTETRTEEVRQQ